MKPFYFQDFVVLVFKSLHEDDDWLCIIREEKYRNDYIRLCAATPQEAAEKAFARYKAMKELEKNLWTKQDDN